MPRDSNLLPSSSRALLRAARAGCNHIRQGARPADTEEPNVTDAEDSAAASGLADRSFTTRKWMTVPKHLEPAEVEFLAKRRPGLPSLYGAAAGIDGTSAASGPMRRTKFKKVDPETGNISIYEAWVPEGHRIEGEITGDVQTIVEQSNVPVKPEAPAPGTIVEGVGIVNAEGVVVAEAGSAAVMTPPKRRPPPPKRKGKGIGKGRKKKVMFAPGEGADAATVHGVGSGAGTHEASLDGQGQQDGSQMSIDQSGQDEDEDDGDEGDDSDDGDESMMDAKTPETPQPPSAAESVGQASMGTPGGQSVDADVDMDDIPEPQPSAPESSLPSGNDAPSQPQPTEDVPPQPQPQQTLDVNASVPIADAPTEKLEEDDKPIISEIDKAPTSPPSAATKTESAEPSAEVGEPQEPETKPLEEENATNPAAEPAPKEEPGLASPQENTSAPPPPAESELPPQPQHLTQSQTPDPPASATETEPKPESVSTSAEPQVTQKSPSQQIDQLDTQEPPAAVPSEQDSHSKTPEATSNLHETIHTEVTGPPTLDQPAVPDPQPTASSEPSFAPPVAAEIPPVTAAESPSVSLPTAAESVPVAEPATASDGPTDTPIEAGVPYASNTATGTEQKEESASEEPKAGLEHLLDPAPDSGSL